VPKFSQLGQPIPLEIPIKPAFVVEYDVSRLTPLLFSQVEEGLEAAGPDSAARVAVLAAALAQVLVGWDFTGDDDSPTPLTAATLAPLGDLRLTACWGRIEQDFFQPSAKQPA